MPVPGNAVPVLSSDYYLELLNYLIDVVLTRRSTLLRASNCRWWRSLRQCEKPAQRLYVRLLLRRGTLFRNDLLSYPEVPDCEQALDNLSTQGMVVRAPASAGLQVLDLLRVADLEVIFPEARGSRAARLSAILGDLSVGEIHARLRAAGFDWFAVLGRAELERLQLAFFGNRHQSITDLITTELGVTPYPRYAIAGQPFDSHHAVDQWLEFGRVRGAAHHLARTGSVDLLMALTRRTEWSCGPRLGPRRRATDSQLARNLERCGEPEPACEIHWRAATPESRERWVRLMRDAGRQVEAARWVERLPSEAWTGPAQQLRARCLAGLEKRRKIAVASTVDLPQSAPVELAVCEMLGTEGRRALWTENSLFSTLFGLIFWEQIFAPVPGAFAHAWQRAPLDLRSAGFRSRRGRAIDQRLQRIRNEGALTLAADSWGRHFGLGCAGVHWNLPWSLLREVLTGIPPLALASVMEYIADDPGRAQRGWPDLVVLGREGPAFVEVKGPGDQLRDEQQDRLALLNGCGIPASVMRVRWTRDSDGAA